MNATLHLADEWEKQPMLKRDARVNILSRLFVFNISLKSRMVHHQYLLNHQI
jgi:hypothetical protein